jgi:TctA family transporter
MIIQGIVPGPNVANQQPELFWGIIASMWIGNVMLVLLNLPLIGIWVRLLSIPYNVLFPAIIVFAAIGVFSVENKAFDLFMMSGLGLLGYVLVKHDCEPVPLLLGFVLGPLLEEHLRRGMLISHGDPMIFLQRPISAGLLAASALVLIVVALPAIARKRETVFVEEG